jgi:hypothetical protein
MKHLPLAKRLMTVQPGRKQQLPPWPFHNKTWDSLPFFALSCMLFFTPMVLHRCKMQHYPAQQDDFISSCIFIIFFKSPDPKTVTKSNTSHPRRLPAKKLPLLSNG